MHRALLRPKPTWIGAALVLCLTYGCSNSPNTTNTNTSQTSSATVVPMTTAASGSTSAPAATVTEILSPTLMPVQPTNTSVEDSQDDYALSVDRFKPGEPAACDLPDVAAPTDLSQTVRVFFTCVPKTGLDIEAVPVRQVSVPPGDDPKLTAMKALLAGTTSEEARAGYYSIFGADTQNIPFSVTVREDGLAIVSFDPVIRTIVRESQDSRIGIFVADADTAQIVTTLAQFPEIQRVAIFIGDQPLCKAIEAC